MKKIFLGLSILLSANLFANSNLDSEVIRTYQYMSNDKTFHHNGEILRFPKYAMYSSCVDKRLVKEETIIKIEQLIQNIQKPFSGGCKVNGKEGYLNTKTVKSKGNGEYIFSSLKIL